MRTRWISLVLRPPILRVVYRKSEHVIVPVRFRQYAGRRYRKKSPVAFDFAAVRDLMGLEPVAIDEEEFGPCGQCIHRPVHGQMCGIENVELLNFLHGCPTHRPGKGFLLNPCPQALTHLWR